MLLYWTQFVFMELASSPLEGHGWSSCLSLPKGIHHRKLGDGGCVLSPLNTCLGLITIFEHWILKDILEKTLVFSFLILSQK